MRTALLSTLELTQGGRPRAFQRLGGRFLLSWQVDLARDLGCSRIVCLADGESEQLDEVREQVEGFGLDFQMVRGPLPLVGLLTADQELVVIADGLVADRELVRELMGQGRGVVALPDDVGIEAGFERIDASHAWGGIIVTRANIAQQLADMPPDSDTISLLLRLALQAGTRLIPLDEEALESGDWLLVRERAALAQREETLLDRSVEQVSWSAPGLALSRRLARALAPDGLERGGTIAMELGALGLVGAIASASYDYAFPAVASFLAGSFAFASGEALAGLKSRLRGTGGAASRARLLHNLLDLALLAVLTLPATAYNALERVFLPLMLIGLLRLAATLAPARGENAWRDRTSVAFVLLVSAWFGSLEQTMAALCVATLGFCLFFRRKSQITLA